MRQQPRLNPKMEAISAVYVSRRLAEPHGSTSRRETDRAGVKGLLHRAVDGHVAEVDRLAA
jgi:hypothetical protein